VQEFLYPEVPQQKREQARSSLQRGVKEFQKLRRLPPEQRTEPAAQLTSQLERLRQDLGTFEQTEATKELRKNIRALQKATSQAAPRNRGQRALQQGFSKLAQKTLQKALEADDLEQMNTALSNLRKSLNQDVTGSQ
jgi:soluble cytochrome b562